MAEKEVSVLKLLIGLQKRANVLGPEKDGCFNPRKKAFFHPRFTAEFDQLVHNGPERMVFQKITNKMYPYVLYCQ